MAIKYTKHVELTMNDLEAHCNATSATLTDEPEGGETLQTFCHSEDVAGTPKGAFAFSAYQDWGMTDSVFELVEAAYRAEPEPEEIDIVFTVGAMTKTFTVKPLNNPPYGGDAGSALVGDMAFTVVGDIVNGTAPTTP